MGYTVLSVAYPLAPVGPDAVGGAEQVLTMVESALVAAGHRSIVVACEGSRPKGTLVATPRWQGSLDGILDQARAHHRRAIQDALNRYPIDLVHMHGQDFPEYLPPGDVPVLATLHVPVEWYNGRLDALRRPNLFLHCVSASQRQRFARGLQFLPDIPNGVPIADLCTRVSKRRYALCLGRIAPEKGYHLAMDAARQADMPLLLAGEVFEYGAHRDYHTREIEPRLNARCRYIGPAGFRRKRRLLTAAQCLLIPSQAPETSSLVAMESLACGTPVIAFRIGALPEIIEHGRTGFLVDSVDEMAEAIRRVHELDPAECRRAAAERFSLQRAAQRYLEQYDRVMALARRPVSCA